MDQGQGQGDRPLVLEGSVADTEPSVEARLLAGYRAMTPAAKLARVVSLNRALDALALAGIRDRHGGALSERELRLRLGALRLSRETMHAVFAWDPAEHGY